MPWRILGSSRRCLRICRRDCTDHHNSRKCYAEPVQKLLEGLSFSKRLVSNDDSGRPVAADARGATTGRQDAPLVQLSSDGSLDSDATRLAVLISHLQRHHPVEVIQFAMPVKKRAYLERRDAPQSRILGP
jgi:hypothetical protein